jgi:hypothetical protein
MERGIWNGDVNEHLSVVVPTGETLHPDFDHPQPLGTHWDWRDPKGNFWRIFPAGRVEPA